MMNNLIKTISVIVNPASGPDIPILALLNRIFKKHQVKWKLYVTQKKQDAIEHTKTALTNNPDAIMVCGGDGTVAEVSSIIYKTHVPLIIVPCGTANIFAKELGIPTGIEQSLEVVGRKPQLLSIDVGLSDNTPFFLRIEAGILADAVKQASRQQKKAMGTLAYPINTLQQLLNVQPTTYLLNLDGKTVTVTGVGLMVGNIGNIGICGVSIQPNVSCFDSKLDVFVLQSADLLSVLGLGTSALIGTTKPSTLKQWQVTKSVEVFINPPQTVVRDDHVIKDDHFMATVEASKLKVLV